MTKTYKLDDGSEQTVKLNFVGENSFKDQFKKVIEDTYKNHNIPKDNR